jgi:hypothetical protein
VKKIGTGFKNVYELTDGVRLPLSNAKKLLGALKEPMQPLPAGAFVLVERINTLRDIANYVHAELSDASMESGLSSSYVSGVGDEFKEITRKYLFIEGVGDDAGLLHGMAESLEGYAVAEIHALFVGHPNTINLYSHYLQHKLNLGHDVDEIMNNLEAAKNVVFGSPGNSPGDAKLRKLQTFGLVPLYQGLTADEIIQKVLVMIASFEYKGGGDDDVWRDLENMSSIFAEKKVGLYVMRQAVPTRIEYDVTALTSRKKLEGFKIGENAGLNGAVLEKFDVIKKLSDKGKKINTIGTDRKMGYVGADRWIVVRTLDNERYDVMGVAKKNLFVSRGLIDNMGRVSGRVGRYGAISNGAVASFLRTPQEIVVESTRTPLVDIANGVRARVIAYMDDRINPPPSSLKELGEIVVSDDIADIVGEILITSYADFETSTERELASTWLYELNGIVKKFIRKLKETYVKSALTEFIFREKTESALVVHLRAELSRIVGSSVEKIFDPQQDIYERVLVKKNLLKVVL